MQKFNCVAGSGWLDVCLNTYGSLDYFVKLMNDNELTPEVPPVTGQVVNWDNTIVSNQSVAISLRAKNIIFATFPFKGNYILTEDRKVFLTEDGVPLILE